MEINVLLKIAKERLLKNNIDEREARLLLSFVLGIRKEELIIYKEIPAEKEEEYLKVIEKRCTGVPYAYIVGHKEFMKLDFEVNNSVLIPRDDTEVLVQEVINTCTSYNMNDKKVNILDLCTGSGCIGISLAKYIKNSSVTCSDISKEALEIAIKNSKANGVNVKFLQSNLFENIKEKYDIIVSNPPYIKTKVIEDLQKEVKENEPIIALDGGETGIKFYEEIIEYAQEFLNPNGMIFFEIGFDQAREVSELLEKKGYENIRVVKDYSDNDRVVIANYNKD